MTDLYIEDPQDGRLTAVEQLRAEMGRLRHQLERAVQDSASDVAMETRVLMHRARRNINARLGTSALIAIAAGLALGLVAAALAGMRRKPD